MQWIYLIIALIVGFGIGHFVCWLGQDSTATDAALAAKITDGTEQGVYIPVHKQQHEKLLLLWHGLRLDRTFDPEETLAQTKFQLFSAKKDTGRLLRLDAYHNGKRPLWIGDRPNNTLSELRNRIDKWPESAMSRIKVEHTQLRRAMELYVGKPEEFGNPFGHIMQRHHFIQEQADQCGYSTILYSLSPSSSIFTPSYVNGFRGCERLPQPSCVETSTSSASPEKNGPPLNGLSDIGFRVQVDTIYPSSHRGT